MQTYASARPFSDDSMGNAGNETLGTFIVRASSAIGGSILLTAMLAALLGH